MDKPIFFIATMSAGKSSLINSLLGINIMPTSNIACTGKIINYINQKDPSYSIEAFDLDNNIIHKLENLEDEGLISKKIREYNLSEEVGLINVYGRIPFFYSNEDIKFVDLPGPNNSNDIRHQKISRQVIENIDKGLIVYVMDGTSLSSDDSNEILELLARKIKNTSVELLFVINKIDYFKDMEELAGIKLEAEKLIEKNGIDNYKIYPVSSLAALSFSEYLSKDRSVALSYMLDNKYYEELALIKKFREDIILDEEMRNEKLPIYNTGIVNVKRAIRELVDSIELGNHKSNNIGIVLEQINQSQLNKHKKDKFNQTVNKMLNSPPEANILKAIVDLVESMKIKNKLN